MSRSLFLTVLILGLLVANIPCYADSPQYHATVTLWVHPVMPSLLSGDRQLSESEYSRFLNTQIELLRHPVVIDRVLESPDVAQLPIIREQQDKRTWLIGKLVIRNGNSELVSVGIATNSAEASEKIVNAVIDAYFNFTQEVSRGMTLELISNLRTEERRQQQVAQTLQARIRQKTREAAAQGAVIGTGGTSRNLVQEESFARDLALAEARLTAMKAQRKGIMERMEKPGLIPVSILVQLSPELKRFNEQREELLQKWEALSQTVSRPEDDPRIVQIDRHIQQIDERIKAMVSSTDSSTLEALQNQFRIQEEVNLFQLELEIRTQEILVEVLTKEYHEQLINNVERTENALDVTFDQFQLERTNRTLDKIEDRILAITTEQRAPARITQLSRAVVSPVPIPAAEQKQP